jgi:hypothetical protein
MSSYYGDETSREENGNKIDDKNLSRWNFNQILKENESIIK